MRRIESCLQMPLVVTGLIFGLLTLSGCTTKNTPEDKHPTLDLSRLSQEQRLAFDGLVQEEICPCGCASTFAGCLNNTCDPALYLGQWIADSLTEGLPLETLALATTKTVTAGYSAAPKPIQLSGYARKGAEHPRFTIVEYADFECPHCRHAALALHALLAERDDVQVVFKHLPLDFHPMAKRAAAAAEAAAEQGQFWPMHDAIFATQLGLTDDMILGHAKALGLDLERFVSDWNAPRILKRVEKSAAEAKRFGVLATPALFINGRRFYLSRDRAGFNTGLAMESARDRVTCR